VTRLPVEYRRLVQQRAQGNGNVQMIVNDGDADHLAKPGTRVMCSLYLCWGAFSYWVSYNALTAEQAKPMSSTAEA